MKFNEKLIELRKKEGLSQEELGYKLNVTRQTISKWELGQTTPEMDRIVEMSKIFNISADELINESEVAPSQNNVIENQPIEKEKTNNNKRTVIIIVGILIIVVVLIIGMSKAFNTGSENIIDKIFGMFNKATEAQQNKGSDIFDEATNIINQVTEEQKNSSSNIPDEFLGLFNNITNNMDPTTEKYDETEKKIAIGNFNGAIELFSGTNNGISVKKVLDKVITSNKTKSKKIIVKYMEKETQDESEIKNIKQNIGDFDNCELTFEYDADGFINKAIIEKL